MLQCCDKGGNDRGRDKSDIGDNSVHIYLWKAAADKQ